MSEIILTIIIALLLGYISYIQHIGIKEREKMMKLLMARNLQEVTDNEIVEKIAPEKPDQPIPNTIAEMNPDDDIAFDKAIESQLEVNPKDN